MVVQRILIAVFGGLGSWLVLSALHAVKSRRANAGGTIVPAGAQLARFILVTTVQVGLGALALWVAGTGLLDLLTAGS
jgi:hypothetical protein